MELYEAQGLLGYLGYYKGSNDDQNGPKTKEAVAAFQRDYGHNLTVDGKFGSLTGAALWTAVTSGWKKPAEVKAEPAQTGDDWWKHLKYFKRTDPFIGCSCGRCGGFPVEPSKKLMFLAEDVRDHFHRAMIPTSTVRCKAHNKEVGGVVTSRHMAGKAMDFYIPGVSAQAIMGYLHTRKDCRYTYNIKGPYVHMDVE